MPRPEVESVVVIRRPSLLDEIRALRQEVQEIAAPSGHELLADAQAQLVRADALLARVKEVVGDPEPERRRAAFYVVRGGERG